MNADVEKNLKRLAIAFGLIVLFAALACVTLWLQRRDIENTIQRKIDNITTVPVSIQKYDQATQTKLDSIDAWRTESHRHVDSYYDDQLQSLLDSLYNAQ